MEERKQPEERVVKLEREPETLWELEPMTGLPGPVESKEDSLSGLGPSS